MKVLIVGAGIAGLTLALCLRRNGHQPLVIERAPQLRDDGYMIDFFGSGYDAASRMRLLDDLAAIHYQIPRLSFVAANGRERFAIGYPTLRRQLFEGRHFNFMRGGLERVLYSKLAADVAVRFGTTLEALRQDGPHLQVELSDRAQETVDLAVGADGVHSHVRQLVFGNNRRFERLLGYHAAAFIIDDPPDGVTEDAFSILTEPHRQVGVYPIRGGRLATFFAHEARPLEHFSLAAARQELHAVYGDMDWIVPQLLRRGDGVADIYFDEVSQIELPTWSRGRVVLVGDACQCVSLLAGQGASMAMAGAYVLAEELHAAGADVAAALARYEARIRPFIARQQRAGRRIARWFVPKSRLHRMVRDVVLRASSRPPASWILRRQIAVQSVFRV